MKTFLVTIICSLAFVAGIGAQSPAGPSPATTAAASASATASPASSPESELEKSIRKKHKGRFNFTIGGHDKKDKDGESDTGKGGADEIPEFVLPIVAVVFFSIFGAPVLVVAVILYFGFSKTRMQHRTIRMMVEKGQPVPPELLAPPPPAVRQRSDMRRGVILLMVGAALTICFGAWNDWENGAWAIGIIPLLVGVGYLLVWKLEGGKGRADNPPPLP